MASIKKRFYKKGYDNQIISDVSIDLRRPNQHLAKKWTVEQKILLKSFINDIEETFKIFINELKKSSS